MRPDTLFGIHPQIKTAYAKQSDYVQEQFFHGLEMNEFNRSLAPEKALWTKVILQLSYWTSDYGQSFLRPLLALLAVDSLLFGCLFALGATGYKSVDWGKIANYWNTIASVLNFMNPLHKTEGLTGMPFIVDTIGRIFSSYMLYNLIRSTRRFVK